MKLDIKNWKQDVSISPQKCYFCLVLGWRDVSYSFPGWLYGILQNPLPEKKWTIFLKTKFVRIRLDIRCFDHSGILSYFG